MKTKTLTNSMLRRIIEEEVSKGFGDMEQPEDVADETDEVEADEYADSLEKQIDYIKALKIEEKRLVKRLGDIRESRRRAVSKITKTL